MADPALEPADPDPFAQVFGQKAEGVSADNDDDPFAKVFAPAGTSSTLGAFGRGAARGAAPAAGSLAGFGAGAEAGFVGGAAIGGPFAEITGPVGGIVGGLAGGYFGAEAVAGAQHWALSKLPDSWREKIGMDDRQEQLDQSEHSTASFLGGLAPFAVTMQPGKIATAALPENATALQRIMAHPATARVFGGAVMGGMELGQEAVQGESPDWTHVAIATAFGMVFNKPTRIGESITEVGARPARAVLGRPHPTLAQASDLNVAGPGVTKEVFEGSHERDPSAAAAAQETARTEQDTIGEPRPPSPYDVARRMEPETFKRWDALQGERNSIRTWIEQFGGTDSAYRNLHEVSDEMVGLEPQVKAAYRRAAEATGTPFIEPEPPEAPVAAAAEPAPPLPPAPEAAAVAAPVAPVKPIEEQKASIVAHVKRRLMAGNPSRNVPGRPADEAESAGRLTAARYEALANWFKGKLGTAEEIYEREAPEIRWHGERADQTPQPRGRRAVNEEKLSLAQFLAHRGGLKPTGDLKAIFDRNPFMPGHGSLFRETGMTLDRAREAAVEAGYINPTEFIGRAGGENTTKISDLLDALQEEARGRKVYRPGQEPEAIRDAGQEAHERAIHEDQQHALEPHELEGPQNFDALPDEAIWDRFVSGRAERREDHQIATGRNDTLGRTGAPIRGAATQAWTPGNVVDIGFVKNRLVSEVRPDGTFTLLSKPDAEGLSQVYSVKPQEGLVKEGKVNFREAVRPLWREEATEPPSHLTEEDRRVMEELFQETGNRSTGTVHSVDASGNPQSFVDPDASQWVLYHGTPSPVPFERFEPTAANRHLSSKTEEGALFLSPAPAEAAHYAGGETSLGRGEAGPRIYPVHVTPGKTRVFDLNEMALHDPEFRRIMREQHSEYANMPTSAADRERFGAVFDQRLKDWEERRKTLQELYSPENLQRMADRGEIDQEVVDNAIKNPPPLDYFPGILSGAGAAIRMAREQGLDTAIIRGLKESNGGDQVVVLTPNRVSGALARDRVLYQRDEAPESPKGERRITIPGLYGTRMTRRQVVREMMSRMEFMESLQEQAKADSSELLKRRIAYQEELLYNLGGALDKFDTADLPRGKPFARSKVIPAGDDFAVRVTTDERHGASDANRTYQIYRRPSGDLETIRQPSKDMGRPLGNVELSRHPDGRWEVDMVQVSPRQRGKGVATALYDAVQKEIGHDMAPSGILLPDGYAFWKKRDPEAVKWHVPFDGYYLSPKRVASAIAKHEGLLDYYDAMDPDSISAALTRHQLEELRNAYDALPPEAKTPQAMREMFQGGVKGSYRPREGDRPPIIRMMRTADASTFMHESAHDWLEQLMRFSEHPLAPDEMKADAQTVKTWLGVDGREDLNPNLEGERGERAVAAHEKFARGFEQYLREGIAPSKELAGIFAKFKQWLLAIYKSLQGLGEPINDDIRGVFDRLLSASPERTIVSAEHPPQDVSLLHHIHPEDARLIEPAEAEPGGDRVFVEFDRHLEELPKEVQAEFEANIAETAAAEAEGWAGANPSAEAGAGAGRSDQVDGAGGKPELVAGSGVGGAQSSDVGAGGPDAVSEGGGVSGAAPAAERRPNDAGPALRDQPLAPRPADTFKPSDAFNVGKNGNVRVENITSVPQLVQAIDEAAQRIPGGGALTMGDMMALESDLGLNAATVTEAHLARIFGGVKNLSTKIWKLREAVKESAQIVIDSMKRAGQSGADADLAAMAEAMARHDMMQSVLSSVTTETGRGLGMSFRNLEGWEKAEDLKTFLKQNTGRTLFQLQRMAKLGAQLDSPAKVSKFLRDAQKRSFGKMILEYWINGLISGVATHMTYAEGNVILMLWKAVPETLTAAAIGKAREAMGRPGERILAGEALAGPRAIGRGLPAATQAMLEAARSGQTTLLPGETAHPLMPFQGDTSLVTARNLSNDPVTWREVGADAYALLRGVRDAFTAGSALLKAGGEPGAPVLGFNYSTLGQIPDIAYRGVTVLPLGSALRIPGRGVAAIHSFFRTLNYLREGAAEAYRVAANEGLEGTAFAARVAEVRTNPSAEQMERWREGATELTLMGQGGKFVKAMSQLTNATVDLPLLGETAPLKFIDPFVHIGANVIKQAVVERTPIGILSAEIRADLMGKNGNVAQDMASARMLAGTAVSLLFGGLAMEGFATGSGPTDRNVAEVWKVGGYLPHSIRIGDLWYDVHKLGPMGMLMGIAADMADVAHEAGKGEMLTAAAHLQHAITQNILDESFMRGPSDLIKAVDDPGRYGEAYLRTMLSSFVPFSVAMAQMARAADPYTRQARTVMDAIKAKIPGLSETLLPRRDIWGEEIPNLEALGAKGLTAIYIKRISNDPVNVALINMGMGISKVERTIRNQHLTDQQYDDFARIAGRALKMRLDVIVRSPDWRTWPNGIKHAVIQESLRQTRDSAENLMFMKYPQILQDATEARKNKFK